MLQGKELGAAIAAALEMKSRVPGAAKVGPSALARALGMSQPSASGLLKTGRLAKEKLPALLAYFEDVVGPDHFGLPFTKFEADFLQLLRRLPVDEQKSLYRKLAAAVEALDAAMAALDFGAGEASSKRNGTDG